MTESVRVLIPEEEVNKRIKEMAENDDRSFSQYVNMVLKEYISKENRTKRNDN